MLPSMRTWYDTLFSSRDVIVSSRSGEKSITSEPVSCIMLWS